MFGSRSPAKCLFYRLDACNHCDTGVNLTYSFPFEYQNKKDIDVIYVDMVNFFVVFYICKGDLS